MAGFSSLRPDGRGLRRICGGTPQARICKPWQFLISTAEYDEVGPAASSIDIANGAPGGILRACLHRAWGRRRTDRAARGGARALGRDVRLARTGADH